MWCRPSPIPTVAYPHYHQLVHWWSIRQRLHIQCCSVWCKSTLSMPSLQEGSFNFMTPPRNLLWLMLQSKTQTQQFSATTISTGTNILGRIQRSTFQANTNIMLFCVAKNHCFLSFTTRFCAERVEKDICRIPLTRTKRWDPYSELSGDILTLRWDPYAEHVEKGICLDKNQDSFIPSCIFQLSRRGQRGI